MDFLFTTTDAAEELTSAKAVLTIHVVHRGYNLGTFVGLGSALAVTAVKAIRGTTPKLVAGLLSPTVGRLLRYSARGSLGGLAFGALAVTGRMWGRDLIEWQDRSWRLLNHAGQTQTDHWSLAGMAVGGAGAALLVKRMQSVTVLPSQPARPQAFVAALRPRTALIGGTAIGSAMAIVTMIGVRALVESGKDSKAMS